LMAAFCSSAFSPGRQPFFGERQARRVVLALAHAMPPARRPSSAATAQEMRAFLMGTTWQAEAIRAGRPFGACWLVKRSRRRGVLRLQEAADVVRSYAKWIPKADRGRILQAVHRLSRLRATTIPQFKRSRGGTDSWNACESSNLRWRRGRDSNPRYGDTVRLISSQVHSTTLPPLQVLRSVGGSSAEARDSNPPASAPTGLRSKAATPRAA
jgi:hypothetical protein